MGKAVKSMKIQVKVENFYPIFHIFQSFPVGQIGVFAEQSLTPPSLMFNTPGLSRTNCLFEQRLVPLSAYRDKRANIPKPHIVILSTMFEFPF